MPAYHVENSILISASQAAVHKHLNNFELWSAWSPWLYTEPDATLTFSGQAGTAGHAFTWDGKLIGSGNMTMTDCSVDNLTMDLAFLKPFKSTAKVRFDIENVGDTENASRVTWHMDSKLPFFMFFMTETIKGLIRSDYARGLKLLKERVETGNITSATELVGIVDVPQIDCIGIQADSIVDELGDSMGQTLPALHSTATENKLQITGVPTAIYNRIDLKTSACTYTAALPVELVDTEIEQNADGFTIRPIQILPCKALKVVHKGKYEHLGNAWSTVIAHQRAQKLKPSKVQPPFEVYLTDPEHNRGESILTEIYLPLR